MKKLLRLTENDLHRIVKESVNRVLNENDWAWPKYGLSDDEYEECKENVKCLVERLYPELRPCDKIEQFFRDTYRDYCKNFNWPDEKIESEYNRVIDIIDKYGLGMAEYNGIPQGWWHYANWLLEKQSI